MPPRTRAGAGAGGDDGNDEPTLLGIVEMNKLFKDVVMFTPQSGVHDTNKALFRAWTRSIMLHAPVLEIVGRHAKADFGDIYDDEWAKIDQSERPQAAHMLAYFLKTKTAATAGAQIELMTWRNLKMIYVRAVAPQPAPAGLSAAAVSEPPWPGPQPRVETMEIFAGSGSMSRALRDSGASVVATCENDPRKAGALANNLPGVHRTRAEPGSSSSRTRCSTSWGSSDTPSTAACSARRSIKASSTCSRTSTTSSSSARHATRPALSTTSRPRFP